MKIVYIAHPVAGDVQENIRKILAIVHFINIYYPDVVPFVPYLADIMADGDDLRERGFKNNKEFFARKMFDELWVFGHISEGVEDEIKWADERQIIVRDFTQDNVFDMKSILSSKMLGTDFGDEYSDFLKQKQKFHPFQNSFVGHTSPLAVPSKPEIPPFKRGFKKK